MTAYILGANGWIPGRNETACLMVEYKNSLFLLDAGTGIANLRHYPDVLARYDTIHLLLSHYHLDHTVGLCYLLPYVRGKRLRIYGPGRPFYPESASFYLHALLREEFFSEPVEKFSDDVQCLDFPGPSFMIGDVRITVDEQVHASPSFRIGLDDQLLYATDLVFQADAWKDVRAKILFHECWDCGESEEKRHASLADLKCRLPMDNFEKIVLIHQNPAWTEHDYDCLRDMTKDTNIIIGSDGMQIS